MNGSNVRLTDITNSKCKGLEIAGLISAALWSDFNMDGWPDLILAGEWMPINLNKNVLGNFQDVTPDTGLENFFGWWNSMVAADFDNDGDIDYIAHNCGLNTHFKVLQDQPMRIVAKDFGMNGILDSVSSHYARVYLSHSSWVCHLPDKLVSIRIITYTGEIRELTKNR